MGKIEIKIRKNRKFRFNLNAVKGQVLFTSIIMAFFSILFAGCKKVDDGSDSKEDLSYLILTYHRYELNNRIFKYTWTYDGYKETGYKCYEDGQLVAERKNYSYDGLNASWDWYSYNDSTNCQHVECEYLDDTYRRAKYQKTQYYYPEPYINETYSEYDGKKKVSSKSYRDGVLTNESHYDYDGLHCTYKTTSYYAYPDVIMQELSYDIVYLDDTYSREKTTSKTRKRYDTDGNLIYSHTYYYVHEYDGKRPIGYQVFYDGKLSTLHRDYHYDGLRYYCFKDTYLDGEVYSTSIEEVEFLE